MATYDGDPSSRFICGLILSLQAHLRRRAAARAALWMAAAALGAMAGLVAVDAAVGLPASVRTVAWLAAAVGGAAAVCVAAGRAWRRRPSAFYVARLIEASRPDLKNSLITFLELDAGPADSVDTDLDPIADLSMRAAVARRAARVLSGTDPIEYLPPVAYRPPTIALAVAAAFLGAGLWLSQGVVIRPWVAAARGNTLAGTDGAGAQSASGSAGARPASADGSVGDPNAMPATPAAEQASAERPQRMDAPSMAQALQADGAKFERLAAALAAGGWNQSEQGGRDSSGPSAGPGGGAAGPGSGERAGSPGAGGGAPGAQGVPSGGSARGSAGGLSGGSPGGSSDASPGGRGAADAAPVPGADATRGSGGPPGIARGAGGGGSSRKASAGSGADGAGGGGADAAVAGGAGAGTSGAAADTGAADANNQRRPSTAGRPSGEPPLLAGRTPSEEFPPGVLDSMRQARRLIEEADRRLQGGDVGDAFLGRMGMGNAELRRFVTAWQRKLEAAQDPPVASGESMPELRTVTVDGSGGAEVLRHAGGADARPIAVPAGGRPEGAGGHVQGGESRVSPRLRRAVSAYFNAVGRMGADGGAADQH